MKLERLLMMLAVVMVSAVTISGAAEPPKLKEDKRAVDRSRPEAGYSGVVKRVMPSVVTVTTVQTVTSQRRGYPPYFDELFGGNGGRPWKRGGLGSGVIITEDGYILTNNHVVDGADADGLRVIMPADKKEYSAKVIGKDPQTDIAVIKIEAKGLKPITLGDSDNVEVGDVALAFGNPFAVGQSVSRGIISALGRSSGILGAGGYEDFIQTDAAINVGNSGGALVDSEGRLIGINESIASESGASAGVGFAVPVNIARSVVERIITDGKVWRGQLGVGIVPVNSDLVEELKLPDSNGAVVTGVLKNSAAAKAGLKPYDVITAVNGKKIADHSQLRVAIAQLRPKTKVTLTIIRDAREKMIEAVLDENKSRMASGSSEDESVESAASSEDLLKGVGLAELDSRTRKQQKIPQEVQGVLVTDVDSSAPASDRLRSGDVIVEVNRKQVSDPDEVRKMTRSAEGHRVMLRVWTDAGGSGFTRLIFLGER